MVTLLDGPSDVICQAWPEQNYPVPLCFKTPLTIGVLPRALCGHGEHGELRRVALRVMLLRVRTNKPDKSYRIDRYDIFESPFSAPFSWGTQSEGFCSQGERLHSGREPRGGDLKHRLAILEASLDRNSRIESVHWKAAFRVHRSVEPRSYRP